VGLECTSTAMAAATSMGTSWDGPESVSSRGNAVALSVHVPGMSTSAGGDPATGSAGRARSPSMSLSVVVEVEMVALHRTKRFALFFSFHQRHVIDQHEPPGFLPPENSTR
jgi:hypothetical protein